MIPKWISTPAAVHYAQRLINEFSLIVEANVVERVSYGPEALTAHIHFADGKERSVNGMWAVEIMQLMKREP